MPAIADPKARFLPLARHLLAKAERGTQPVLVRLAQWHLDLRVELSLERLARFPKGNA